MRRGWNQTEIENLIHNLIRIQCIYWIRYKINDRASILTVNWGGYNWSCPLEIVGYDFCVVLNNPVVVGPPAIRLFVLCSAVFGTVKMKLHRGENYIIQLFWVTKRKWKRISFRLIQMLPINSQMTLLSDISSLIFFIHIEFEMVRIIVN